MKKLLPALFLTLAIGCASFQTGARSFLTKTAVSVDATMKAWAAYVVISNVSEAKQQPVKAAYQQYQAAFAAATNAYWASVMQSNPALFTGASNNLVKAKTTLATSTAH